MRRALLWAGLVAALPAASPAIDLRPSTQEQIKLGQDAAKVIRKEEKILPDSDPRVKFMRSLADRLIATIPEAERKQKPWQYSFDIVDSDEVNAFALPGGPIFFYRGLVDRFDTQDQFAAVLAHEMAHVRHTHWASQYADNLKRQLGVSILLGVVGADRLTTEIVGLADTVAFTLPYSRKHETEADTSGFNMMVAAGFNPQGMVDVFRKFEELKRGQGAPEFISTHPDDKNRIKRLSDMVTKSGKTYPAQRPLPYPKPERKPSKDTVNKPAGK